MSDGVVLEVIGGPMDGLRGLIVKKGTVGRKVGNSLSLALDEEVSGQHVEIVREGHDWCVRDLNSTNGTFHMHGKLQTGRSYPLQVNDVLLVGSTILLINPEREGEEHVPFSEASFNDPRTHYTMTPGLKHVWNNLFRAIEEEHTANRYFCDVDRLFLSLMEAEGEKSAAGYDCVSQINSAGRYQILAQWLVKTSVGNSFRSPAGGSLTVAPRVWRVMTLAAGRKKGPIGIGDILGAMLEERGSLAARYMHNDKRFMDTVGMKCRRGASDSTVMDVVRTVKKNQAPPAHPAVVRGSAEDAEPPTIISGPRSQVAPLYVAPGLDDTWKDFGQRLERLVSGFLADAINPVASHHDFRPPGLEQKLEEVLAGAADRTLLNQRVKQHLDTIFKLLVVILTAQHDGYKVFGDHFCTILESMASELKDGRSLMRSIGKKNVDVEELMVKVKAMLRRMESEGVSETIVRDIIKKKMQQQGL